MNKTKSLKINADLHNRTIKNILEKHLGFSNTLIKHLKADSGAISLNGERAKLITKVHEGDVLQVYITDTTSKIEPSDIPLDILYEDDDIIVINKPRSMPTHPSKDHISDTLANGLMFYFHGDFTFRPITRLDKDTSGIVLIAKHALSAQILTCDMKNKKIYKEYIAVVNGVPKPSSGVISCPITRLENSGIRRTSSQKGKEAITHYETLKTLNNLSLVRLCPITGRTHQLRVHMSYIGTPIYGDWLYNTTPSDKKTRLHCHQLTFYHPITKVKTVIKAPVPSDITELMGT